MKNRCNVVVDVFSWVTAAIGHPSIPIEGIYRHAESLALNFHPAIFRTPADEAKYPGLFEALATIELYLKKPIKVYTSIEQIVADKVNVWLSIALDSPAPILAELKTAGIYRVAVLHDTMAYQGLFGAGNQSTFDYGTRNNDCLLPVSEFAWKDYQQLEGKVPIIRDRIKYNCFHRFATFPQVKQKLTRSISIGTVYPRKRVVATAKAGLSLCMNNHHHVGRVVESENDAELYQLLNMGRLKLHGFVNDETMTSLLSESFAYINLSEQEGFSMPPLEAIVLGVPYIFLSDIPAHRELYSDVANFIEVDEALNLGRSKAVSSERRRRYFEKYCFSAVIKPFLDFLT